MTHHKAKTTEKSALLPDRKNAGFEKRNRN
jgi:hypothetical protein